MYDDNALFSEFGMDLWRKMSQDLNYNVMFSPRGIINLAHSDAQMNVYARRGNSMRLNGIDAVLLNREQVKDCLLYTSPSPRDGLLSRMPSSA